MKRLHLLAACAALVLAPAAAFAQSVAIPFTPGSGGNLGGDACGSYTCPRQTSTSSAAITNPPSVLNSTATTGYTANQLVANSTSSPTATCFSLPATAAGSALPGFRLIATDTGWAGVQFKVDYFAGPPTYNTADHTSYTGALGGAANWIGSGSGTFSTYTFSDGVVGRIAPDTSTPFVKLGVGVQNICWTLQTMGASGTLAGTGKTITLVAELPN